MGAGFGEGEGPLFQRGPLPLLKSAYIFAKACSRSARIPLIFSMPTESRTTPGVIPALTSYSSVSWWCVELVGYSMQVRVSATCTSRRAILRLSMNRAPVSCPSLDEKEITPPRPLGRYLVAYSL